MTKGVKVGIHRIHFILFWHTFSCQLHNPRANRSRSRNKLTDIFTLIYFANKVYYIWRCDLLYLRNSFNLWVADRALFLMDRQFSSRLHSLNFVCFSTFKLLIRSYYKLTYDFPLDSKNYTILPRYNIRSQHL